MADADTRRGAVEAELEAARREVRRLEGTANGAVATRQGIQSEVRGGRARVLNGELHARPHGQGR
jgi:hypothetical protein